MITRNATEGATREGAGPESLDSQPVLVKGDWITPAESTQRVDVWVVEVPDEAVSPGFRQANLERARRVGPVFGIPDITIRYFRSTENRELAEAQCAHTCRYFAERGIEREPLLVPQRSDLHAFTYRYMVRDGEIRYGVDTVFLYGDSRHFGASDSPESTIAHECAHLVLDGGQGLHWKNAAQESVAFPVGHRWFSLQRGFEQLSATERAIFHQAIRLADTPERVMEEFETVMNTARRKRQACGRTPVCPTKPCKAGKSRNVPRGALPRRLRTR